MRTTCLITGCALRLQHHSDYAWGDLHRQGDRFIFNAVLDGDTGQTAWFQEGHDHSRCVTILVGEDYFERRGVFVFRADLAHLSAAARAHAGA